MVLAFTVLFSLFLVTQILPGCALTHLVEENYAGFDTEPKYPNRRALGVFLMPFAAAADIATSPIQGLMLIIGGDEILYEDGKPFWKDSEE